MIIEILQVASCFTLGLLIGSLLTEAMILVPYWQKMDPNDFLKLHSTLGPKLYTYFAPLTIIGTMTPILSGIISLMTNDQWLPLIPAVMTSIMLIIYFAYFKGANESFKTGSVSVEDLSQELTRWENWHWLRVSLGLIAFLTSILVFI